MCPGQIRFVWPLRDAKITLLIPLFLYNGLSLGFLFGDFTNDVIHPALGLNNTGFVMATFFFVNAVFSYVVFFQERDLQSYEHTHQTTDTPRVAKQWESLDSEEHRTCTYRS